MNQYLKQTASTLAGSGLAIYDDRISAAHSIVSELYATLRLLDERMYEPAPSPSPMDKVTAPPSSIEAQLTLLVERLRDVNAIANKLIGGPERDRT